MKLKKWHWFILGLIFFTLGSTYILAVFTKEEDPWSSINIEHLDLDPKPTAEAISWNEAYIYERGTKLGQITKKSVNGSYWKQKIRNNFEWQLKASNNGDDWYDADELLSVQIDWNEQKTNGKVSLILNTTGAPKDLYYRFDMAVKSAVKKYINKSKWEYRLTIPANATEDYNLYFNFSDIRELVDSGKVTFKRGITNYQGSEYFYFRVKTVNKIAPNREFIVDPELGTILTDVVDTYEFANVFGDHPNIHRMGDSNYCIIAYKGEDSDGFIETFYIPANGSINQVDQWEFDTTSAGLPQLGYIDNDIWVCFYDRGSNPDLCELFSFRAFSSNGTIMEEKLNWSHSDDDSGSSNDYNHMDLLVIDDDTVDGFRVFTIRELGIYNYEQTFWVLDDGNVSYNTTDTHDHTNGVETNILYQIDNNTVLVAYLKDDSDALRTVNCGGDGKISTQIDGYSPTPYGPDLGRSSLCNVDGNIWVMVSDNSTLTGDGFYNTTAFTFEVDDDGNWVTANYDHIDRMNLHTLNGYHCWVIPIGDGNTNAFLNVQGDNTKNIFQTFVVNDDGSMGDDYGIIDSGVMTDGAQAYVYPETVYMGNNMYACVYQEYTSSDGWMETFEIQSYVTTTFSNATPSKNSINQSMSTVLEIDVNHATGNSTNCNFYISTDGETYTNEQYNASVTANSTIRCDLSSYLTNNQHTYYWKVTAYDTGDGTNETSDTYSFETTPYRTLFFNDTFPNENFIHSSYNMSDFESGWQNFSNSSGGSLAPSAEDFEDALDTDDWHTYESNGYGRNQRDTAEKYRGSYSWRMDSTTDGNYVNNVLYTQFDFTGATNITLDFWEKDTGDEEHDVAESFIGWQNADYVAYTNDNTTWYEIVTASELNNANWENFNIDIHDDADFSSPATSSFAIRFSQYDNYEYNSDGRWWDDINITHNVPSVGGFKDAHIISDIIWLPDSYSWDKLYADVNNTVNCDFALIDSYNATHNISSGLNGDGDDISSITNSSLRIYANFSEIGVNMGSWNITWATAEEEEPAWNQTEIFCFGIENTSVSNNQAEIFCFGIENTSAVMNQAEIFCFGIENTSATNQQVEIFCFGIENTSVSNNQAEIFTFGIENTSIANYQKEIFCFGIENTSATNQQVEIFCFGIENTSAVINQVEIFTFGIKNTTMAFNQKEIFCFGIQNTSIPNVQEEIFCFGIRNISNITIFITNVYPSDGNTSVSLQPIIYATVNNTKGRIMNISWTYSLDNVDFYSLSTNTGVYNGTYTSNYYTAVSEETTYYWKIEAEDNTSSVSETYEFTTGSTASTINVSSNLIYSVLGILAFFGLIGIIIYKRKKENRL